MPIFTSQLGQINYNNAPEAIKAMANHLRYIQEQLEYTLMNLDSSNVTELNTNETNISSSSGSSFSGNRITLKGDKGEVFEVGTENGIFQFRLNGQNGSQLFYLTNDGNLVFTDGPTIKIDCGEW